MALYFSTAFVIIIKLHVHLLPCFNLPTETQGCTKFGSEVVITWEIDGEREYTYTVKDSSGVVKKSKSFIACFEILQPLIV